MRSLTQRAWSWTPSGQCLSEEVILTLPGEMVAYSPNGGRLASSSVDGTTRVYAVDVDDLVALARSRLTRWFTPAECKQYLHMDVCPPEP